MTYSNWRNGTNYGVFDYFYKAYSSRWALTYWYIYAYLAVLMLLPILRKMARNMSNKEFVYFFCITIVVSGVIPITDYLLFNETDTLYSKFRSMFFDTGIMYFLMGYFLEKRIPEEKLSIKKGIIVSLLGIVAIIVSCLMTQYQINVIGKGIEGATQDFYSLLIVFPTVAIFYCIRIVFVKKNVNGLFSKVIVMLGGASFGVMLMENILREELKIIVIELKDKIHRLPACVIWVLSVWLV